MSSTCEAISEVPTNPDEIPSDRAGHAPCSSPRNGDDENARGCIKNQIPHPKDEDEDNPAHNGIPPFTIIAHGSNPRVQIVLWNAISWTPEGEDGIRQIKRFPIAATLGFPARIAGKQFDAFLKAFLYRNEAQPSECPRLLSW
jgi:hypothetical protein